MPIYVVDHRGGPPTATFERSPRVALETDASSASDLPEEIRLAAASASLQTLNAIRTDQIPGEADAIVTFLAGERLLQGSTAKILRDIRTLGRRCFVPVHLPCLAELDLLALEPRWLSGGQMEDFWSTAARITRPAPASQQFVSTLNQIDRPWAKLSQALIADNTRHGAGVEALARVAKDSATPNQIGALALRNLVVILMRLRDFAKAEQVLRGALDSFTEYADLHYVAALLYVNQGKTMQALKHLDCARAANHGFLGSGGESSYRAGWLVGKLAAQAGKEAAAFENFYYAMMNRPAFTPAVDEILKMRVPPSLVEKHQYDFCRFARQEPRYLDRVFDFLLLHRAFSAAKRIVQTMPLEPEQKERLLESLASSEAPFRPNGNRDGRPGVLVCGSFFEQSSLARINRQIATALMQSSEFDFTLEPFCHPQMPVQAVPGGKQLSEAILRAPKSLDLTIRHHWPPNFERPTRGKLAVIVPWEYGAVPRMWVEQIERNVDELWVPSAFVRGVFVRAGVSEQRVRVIPNGFDPKILNPEGPTSRPKGCRRFVFLFVGGAIRRKGIDVLLDAYAEAFEPGDDVTLAVSTGANPAYAHNSLDAQLREFMTNTRLPHLSLLSEQLDDATLASLYRGCDAFVLPYRGEGFGMPVAEAMACGKPVITTAAGPVPEFCPSDCGYFVPAIETEVPDSLPPFGEFVGNWTWFEPDIAALARTMRYVYEHREEAASRGRKAARAIRQNYSWDKITSLYLQRVAKLTETDSSKISQIEKTAQRDQECQASLCP